MINRKRALTLKLKQQVLPDDFVKHQTKYKDTWLKYIQSCTLHKRFYTNERLYKKGIKDSGVCGICKKEIDSVEHILLNCEVSKMLWSEMNV